MSGTRPSGARPPQAGASLALAVLVALAIFAPWPFGSVGRTALAVVTAASLGTAVLVLALAARHGGLVLPALPLWPLGCFVALGVGQLVPLPPCLHAWLAPGSHVVWHPAEPAAAAVLGAGAHPLSLDPATTLHAAALLAGLGLLAVAAAPALAGAAGAKRAIGALAAGGFALSAYAIWARARFGPLLYGTLSVPTVTPFGPFVNKNHFAGWTAMAALLAAGLAAGLADEARGRGRDWTVGRHAGSVVLAVISSLAMALAVLASLSRSGAAGLAAGAACLTALLLARPLARPQAARRPVLAPGLAIAAVLVAVVVALAPPAAHERLRTLAGAEFRIATWRDALRLAASSPLVGHGLGAFHDAFPRAKRDNGTLRVEHAESEYLETLAETGAAGLTLALCGLVSLLRAGGWRGGEAAAASRGIARGATAALVALAVHGALDFPLRIPSNAALAALAAAAAAAGAGVRPAPLGRSATVAFASAALALLVATLALSGRAPSPARDDVREAWSSTSAPVRALRLARAEAVLAPALRLRPADAEGWLLLAGVRAARGDPWAGSALARHAAWLDPQRPDLRAAASRLARLPADSP